MSGATHPGRSLDFLSRLHDEELSAAERAQFESHRAHCAECRKAAAEFEAALAFYRTAGTTPAPSDLAARILRKLEASNPRRSPFGIVFGIDLKWAGAFTAALILVILGYSLADRQRQSQEIRVSFVKPTPASSADLPGAPPRLLATRQPRLADSRQEVRREAKAESAKKTAAAPADAPSLAARERDEKAMPPPVAASAPVADRLEPAPTALRAAGSTAPTRQKGLRSSVQSQEAAAASAEVQGLLAATPVPIRIIASALDSEGAAPEVLNAAELPWKREDRGQYVLVVGADGVPLEVGRPDPGLEKENAALARPASRTLPETLRKLRFQPGGRPRRLLLRVE